METIIIIILLVVVIETTYLVAVNTKKLKHKKFNRPIFVDTSVLIDGRILAVAESGFIGDTLLIPRSVIGELQFLADNADAEKRSRARHGLDVVSELQKMTSVKVEIYQDGSKAEEGVDERLLKLARENSGAVCTIDFNLNKVAHVEGIDVLNVNDLAMSLRMAYLPGEKILLELTQKGQDRHQSVGHLADGTMVVVENSSDSIGQTVEIEFIRSLQTSAGKMMFAKTVSSANNNQSDKNSKPKGRIINKALTEPKTAKVEQKSYHSDKREQNRVSGRQTGQSTHRGQDQASGGDNRQKTSQSQTKARKPRTSAQNEADLIKLVNEQ